MNRTGGERTLCTTSDRVVTAINIGGWRKMRQGKDDSICSEIRHTKKFFAIMLALNETFKSQILSLFFMLY